MRTTAGVLFALALLGAPALADKKLDEAVAKAEEQLQKGKPDEALKGLQRAVQSSPSTEGWLALSRFQERLGNLDEAMKSAAAAAAAPGTKADAQAAQSSLALLVSSGKEALTLAQEAASGGTPAGLAALARAGPRRRRPCRAGVGGQGDRGRRFERRRARGQGRRAARARPQGRGDRGVQEGARAGSEAEPCA